MYNSVTHKIHLVRNTTFETRSKRYFYPLQKLLRTTEIYWTQPDDRNKLFERILLIFYVIIKDSSIN